ncbi:hypothetical protein XA68_10002 [Ophiocordyceps unilateralis]|uniref:Uncharacterized protein n=1 Tax=Ophiocordyceps unilateralis TaxID=268505 RepID=A0A2A9PV39_OPHUN|nr:hypothetical protein XA68_10002 [Ophiocordyceps unilateralis]
MEGRAVDSTSERENSGEKVVGSGTQSEGGRSGGKEAGSRQGRRSRREMGDSDAALVRNKEKRRRRSAVVTLLSPIDCGYSITVPDFGER